jgi:hypothetical protein
LSLWDAAQRTASAGHDVDEVCKQALSLLSTCARCPVSDDARVNLRTISPQNRWAVRPSSTLGGKGIGTVALFPAGLRDALGL